VAQLFTQAMPAKTLVPPSSQVAPWKMLVLTFEVTDITRRFTFA